jgi:hypothetical protein
MIQTQHSESEEKQTVIRPAAFLPLQQPCRTKVASLASETRNRVSGRRIDIICKASMVCCQVFVEFGMTKPKWKFHSFDRQQALIQNLCEKMQNCFQDFQDKFLPKVRL